MAEKKPRRRHSLERKAQVVRRHLRDKVPVSDLCDEYGLQPSMVYGWIRQVLENAELALEAGKRRRNSRESKLLREAEALRAKLAKRDHVIAEISEEYVQLKKELGDP